MSDEKDRIEEIDVLDILGDVENQNDNTDNNSDNENNEEQDKADKLLSLIKSDDLFDMTGNEGSGDVQQDLINWLMNFDKLPSDPLTAFMSNSDLKAQYALFFLLLTNLSRIKIISEFIKQSESVLFDVDNILNLDTEEIKERYVYANKIMDNLIEHSRKLVYSIIKEKQKNKNADETDKLKMLLGSLPTDKIKELIKELR